VTGSVASLDYLIDKVKEENEKWDDHTKVAYIRAFFVRAAAYLPCII
jgi:hypothetical protein